MMDFKVEYVQERNLSTLPWSAADRSTSVVRLAEVETLIQEAEWAMRMFLFYAEFHKKEIAQSEIDHAQACLASIAAWRTGQEGGHDGSTKKI